MDVSSSPVHLRHLTIHKYVELKVNVQIYLAVYTEMYMHFFKKVCQYFFKLMSDYLDYFALSIHLICYFLIPVYSV